MLFIKIMGADNKQDTNRSKSFELMCISEDAHIKFSHVTDEDGIFIAKVAGSNIITTPRHVEKGQAKMEVYVNGESETYFPEGDVYVMNSDGNTIASFAHYSFDDV